MVSDLVDSVLQQSVHGAEWSVDEEGVHVRQVLQDGRAVL